MRRWRFFCAVLVLGWSSWCAMSSADEGMWLFNNPPREPLKTKYGFEPSDAWLEHLQKSAVRFNNGGSGSFVSSQGLVMTNHHVGADALQKLSSPGRDLLTDGFYARQRSDELPCVDLELNVLENIEDVTARVNAAVPQDLAPADAEKARRAVMSTIEKESQDATGLRSDVVTLYQGGLYHLYRYRRYTDVRLVFAPEKAIAFFGGDPDNFEYPRYDLDVCFFRVYENGEPLRVAHHLGWSAAGAQEGELILVAGHPGRTNRLNTVRHLEFLRDESLPFVLNYIRRVEVLLKTYSDRSAENARRAQDELFGFQNSRKARLGQLAGLQDPRVMAGKRAAEETLRKQVAADASLRADHAGAWDEVDRSLEVWREIFVRYSLWEQGYGLNSELFRIARTLVRLAEEQPKPNAERLREFRDSNRESLELELFSDAPLYDDLERLKLADGLALLMETFGAADPLVVETLAGKSPPERAAELIAGSHLQEVAVRRKLAEGGQQALAASDDALIRLARAVDVPTRAVRKRQEEEVEEPQRQAYAKIAAARFATQGTSNYPDATFTLRLAYGVVQGYQDQGRDLPPWTTLGGTFAHAEDHGYRPPFDLPQRWLDRREQMPLDTPFNFVSTADIIGGNSGSPVVNRAGEVVGLIFDGNIHSLVLAFAYTEEQARATSVHSSAIREALRTVYDAAALADELGK